jgi:molybdate transport system substrate-binding protein
MVRGRTLHSARRLWRSLLGLTLGFVLGGCKDEAAAPEPALVAAAADLSLAFEELGRSFEQQTGQRVSFTFGSTGLLAQQLREGAPYDVFAAANVSFVDQVIHADACDAASKARYARGRIAVWTKATGLRPPASLAELAEARFVRVAIANPEHAPYGQAAREALQKLGIWSQLQPKLVLGDNVRQTFQFAESGNVEAAVVALALVIHDRNDPWLLVDETLHRPIDQALVVCRHGKNQKVGRRFAEFVNSPPGRAVMQRYGFLLPGERLTQAP